jgi:hypothetical protein
LACWHQTGEKVGVCCNLSAFLAAFAVRVNETDTFADDENEEDDYFDFDDISEVSCVTSAALDMPSPPNLEESFEVLWSCGLCFALLRKAFQRLETSTVTGLTVCFLCADLSIYILGDLGLGFSSRELQSMNTGR